MGRFYNIHRDEMHDFLSNLGFRSMSLPHVVELVYGKILRHEDQTMSLRIYTGINPSGESRGKGEDAIRLQLYWKLDDEPVYVGRKQLCQRVKNWQKNISAAIGRVLDSDHFQICPVCKSPMVYREGQYGPFWACATWFKTKCSGKIPLKA